MSYQVLARKYRPMIFNEIVGQEHVTNTLRNALATKRVAHAYLFSGTRGCGKTTTARILARALNCESPIHNNPDNTCSTCIEIIEGRSLDVIEIDGASNRGVEEIRNLRESVRYTPVRGKYKVYIIDEVHMLTKEAFNALLKTLEEPPSHVVFIFATTEVHKMPMTILSRCQRFDFRRISVKEIVGNLKTIAEAEQLTVEEEALQIIARRADGSLRDAQSILEQVRSFCGQAITARELLSAFHVVDQELYFQFTNHCKTKNTAGVLMLIDDVLKSGYDIREFTIGLLEHLRNLLVVQTTGTTTLLEVSDEYAQRYRNEAKEFSETDLLRYIKLATELEQSLRWASQPRYCLEAALLRMVTMAKSVELKGLIDLIVDLKKKLESTQSVPNFGKSSSELQEPASKFSISFSHQGSQSTSPTKVQTFYEPSSPYDPPVSFSTVHPVITPDEVQQYWTNFVDNVYQERKVVGISLRESKVVEVKNGTLALGCVDDYHYDALRRYKEYLTNTIQKMTGKKVIVEPRLLKNKTFSSQTAAKGEKALHDSEGHPIIQILRRELGAEPID
ncbi:MAG: DNA polymerase III subunit gamma/tau [Bacteroidetes bacterium]|nr:DNA polymerase III subunit gamma/tau [Bacteroidota bacterium]